jgi:hypothetical protein
MKNKFLVALMAALSAVSCSKDADSLPQPAPTVTKTVNFTIHQAKDYADVQYNGVQAELKITVSKFKKADGQMIVLWDSAVAFQSIRNYPATHLPVAVVKSFSGINDQTETVQASYGIRYKNSRNELSAVGKNEFADLGVSVLTLPGRL